MTDIQAGAIGTAALVLLVLGVGYVHPVSRPYVRKYGWLALVPFAFLAGVAFLAGRGRCQEVEEGDGGAAVAEASKAVVKDLAEHALAMSADADADLAARRLEAEATTTEAREVLVAFRVDVEEARKVEDAAARRAALIALVESTKR